MHLELVSGRFPRRRGQRSEMGVRKRHRYLSRRKATPTTNASSRTVQCSAFTKTFQRQYMKAAIHRNHSRKAANITTPMMAV